jgi:hypothetical protein
MFNSFKGYNDVAHARELSKEVVWVAAKSSRADRELWPRAAKTGVAYQESFVLRDPAVVPKGSPERSRRPETRKALPRSMQNLLQSRTPPVA